MKHFLCAPCLPLSNGSLDTLVDIKQWEVDNSLNQEIRNVGSYFVYLFCKKKGGFS
jgi:hypothetical protein